MTSVYKKEQKLDRVFAALADSSRRQMLVQLRKRPLTISELAGQYSISFAGVAKHVHVLEEAGLVHKVRDSEDGRRTRLQLANQTLNEATAWLEYHQKFWTDKLNQLETYIMQDGADHE